MSPFTACAQTDKDVTDPRMPTVIRLRLDPISSEVRISDPVVFGGDPFRLKVEASRDLLRATRKVAALALYRAVAGSDAPPDFDWEQMDRDALEDALARNHELKRRVEAKDIIIRRYRMFMEASGKSWEAIERI